MSLSAKLGSVLAMLAWSISAHAASITLQSVNSGVFQYELTLAPGDSIVFDMNAQIDLTGLSGVTAISPLDRGFSACGFTDATACFMENFVTETFSNPGSSPTMFNLFTITSDALSIGPVDYNAAATSPFAGQVDGPIAAPEASSGVLVALGLFVLGFLSLRLRRSARVSQTP